MDAPPPENLATFIRITAHLHQLGVRVAEIIATDLPHGFLLLEDLGRDTFTHCLAAGAPELPLYQSALQALVAIQTHPRATAIALAPYAENGWWAEARLFTDWYFPAVGGTSLSPAQHRHYQQTWQAIFAALPPLPPTLVLRDYHVDNLMRVAGQCAVLDYQDAVLGSPAYDLVSLLQDARRELNTEVRAALWADYLVARPDLDPTILATHYAVWGAHRHCKVAGIFTRLWLRDHKTQYLQHLPRVLQMLTDNIKHPALRPLKQWCDDNGIECTPHFRHARQTLRTLLGLDRTPS